MNFLGNLLGNIGPLMANAASAMAGMEGAQQMAGPTGFAGDQGLSIAGSPQLSALSDVLQDRLGHSEGVSGGSLPGVISETGASRRQMGPALSNFLGNVGGAPLDGTSRINDALASNAMLPAPRQQQRGPDGDAGLLGKVFGQKAGGTIRNVLGALGDALLVANGQQAVYRPRMERRRVAEAMASMGQGGDDMEALRRIYEINPELGMRAEDQLHQRRERAREGQARTAAGDLLLGTDPTARERIIRADPGSYLDLEDKRATVTQRQVDGHRKLNDLGMQILGGVHDQASWDRAKNAAGALYRRYGLSDIMPELPEAYDPAYIRDLQLKGMDTNQQLATIARENKLRWDQEDDRADNERADRNTDSLINDRREKPKGRSSGNRTPAPPRTEEALVTDIQRRWSQGEQITPGEREIVRAYNARRNFKLRNSGRKGGAKPQGGGSGDGAIIRNPETGERMVLRGGKWVPIQ